jgi:hypothetical protein
VHIERTGHDGARGQEQKPARPAGKARGSMLSFARELWAFLRARKKFWLLPIIITMALFGGLVVLTQGSAVAPFIYTLF